MLSSLVKNSSNDVTPSTVWGNMLHEVVQLCLAEGQWSEEFIDQSVDHALDNHLDELVKIRMGFPEARTEVKKRAVGLVKFSEVYISDVPKVCSLSTPGHPLHI